MQASEIVNRVRQELVESVGAFWQDPELLTLLNKAERDFVNKTRILDDRATLDVVQGQYRYPLPSNWLSARAIFYDEQRSGTQDWRRLRPTNLEKLGQERPNFMASDTVLQATPLEYAIWGREIYILPIPRYSGTANLVLFFKSKPIPITSTSQQINIDDSLSDALEAYMLWKAWKKEKEPDLADEARDEYNRFVREGLRFVKKQSGDQRFRIDIDSPVPFSGAMGGLNPFFP